MDILKISRLVACGLLFIAIAKLPYGYYQFLKIVVTITAAVNAYDVFERENKFLFFAFAFIAILFNPLIPIHLNRDIWASIDVILGVFFGLTALLKTPENNDEADT